MPVYIDGNLANHDLATGLRGSSLADLAGSHSSCINIGLINNMPDAALQATERQFVTLLDSSSGGVLVRLSLFALPEIARTDAGRLHVSRSYSGIESLWNNQLDGLIVTGKEPRTSKLIDEPYWGSLTRVLEWAKDNTHSTIWSCLAAHAAILRLDGIERRKSNEKRCGVLPCVRLSDHELMAGVRSSLQMPHSRWNDVPEDDLTACGYRVLTRTQDAGVDTFIKRQKSLFVFFQGHPEYESDTLLLEYRRDVGRYLRQETDIYPSMPQTYFDKDTACALENLRERAMSGHREGVSADLSSIFGDTRIRNTWHVPASRMYGNWLGYIYRRKQRQLSTSKFARNGRGVGSETLKIRSIPAG